jgi:phage terminase large subunit-like protein
VTFDPIRNPSDTLALEQGCTFDEARGAQACNFIEKFCKQSKGKWGGKPIVLIDWERDLVMRMFGWRRPDGTRRFRTVYVEVPKKNGKSTLVSALVIFLELSASIDDKAPEVYLNAVDRQQADIVFEEAARMVEASPSLSARLSISRYHGTITDPKCYGKIQKNSADAPSKDGVNASAVVFDEIHRFENRRVWDILTYAGTSRAEPIRIVITTAGEESEGIWYEQREFSEKINAGEIENTTHLGVIYRALTEADEGGPDDLDDPATWCKANPSMGHTMSIEDFARELEEAKAKGGAELANFFRLRLGIVARAEGKYTDMVAWNECAQAPRPDPDDPCWMGLDLSSRDDLSALVILSGNVSDGFDVECRFWLPRDIIADLERRHGQPYRAWADRGLITLTAGNTIDEDFIEDEIVRLAEERNLQKLLADPWHARHLGESLLNNHGLPVEWIRQGYASISEPTKTLRDWIVGRKLRHGGHPILKWHAGNAVSRQDPAGNIKLDKERSRKKIDGMAALVNAAAGVVVSPEPEPSVYEGRGLLTI